MRLPRRAGEALVTEIARRARAEQALREAHDRFQQQSRANQALRRLNNRLELQARRVAGVLHDEAGQLLASTQLALADLAGRAPQSLRAELQDLRAALDQISTELRQVSHELHPGVLDAFGLSEAIGFVADSFVRRTGVRLEVDVDLDPDCPAHLQGVIYQLVQEGLHNMGAHARARSGAIVLRREGAFLCCSIVDDGVGFDAGVAARSGCLGLALIEDRFAALGGTLQILSSPGRGTELRAMIPEER